MVVGEGAAVAVSKDRGRARDPVNGRANVRAKAASEGNEGMGELVRGGSATVSCLVGAGGGGGGLLPSGGGEGGSGGCDSEVCHASFAAFSSALTSGSNSSRISCFTGSDSCCGSGVGTNPGAAAGSNLGRSCAFAALSKGTLVSEGSLLPCHGSDGISCIEAGCDICSPERDSSMLGSCDLGSVDINGR